MPFTGMPIGTAPKVDRSWLMTRVGPRSFSPFMSSSVRIGLSEAIAVGP